MTDPELLRLIVRPTVPGHFQASIETDPDAVNSVKGPLIVVVSSRQPLVDGARRLLELGHDPGVPLTMRHAGKDYDSFEPQPVGTWAAMTYTERDHGTLRVEQWKPDPRYAKASKDDNDGSAGT